MVGVQQNITTIPRGRGGSLGQTKSDNATSTVLKPMDEYFEFENKTGSCQVFNQEITKSNQYHGVKCFKMGSATYTPIGPQILIPEIMVTNGGWILCHNETYSVPMTDSSISAIQGKCTGDKIMLACRQAGAAALTTLAWADKATVFGVTDSPQCRKSCLANVAQGTKWYRSTKGGGSDGAWGFADEGSNINLYPRDYTDEMDGEVELDGEKRISWTVNSPYAYGGWRCGTTLDLDTRYEKSQDWERVFYHAN